MNKLCRGCRAGGCLFVKWQCEHLCSCVDCLVKVICNQWCEKRLEDTRLIPMEEKKRIDGTREYYI
jgi:hypothetical protein